MTEQDYRITYQIPGDLATYQRFIPATSTHHAGEKFHEEEPNLNILNIE